ncbi:hypothetical protein [Qipengyuania qiaonensis]|uniref:Uncharacterized protein n=1 Tax=Qipengyuania qiaonensis TaxID=2867240 RepID=A0ABS7JEV8_9SPHN|nr:hypothetical protein [Qipengyuania qiaonensis]MBX7483552.1 hypothetical protein [Qipengyuania qiaonensis]
MRAFVRNLALAALALASTAAHAGDGVYLPPAPQGPGGEDSIETADGTRCRQSINSNGPYLDMGATGQAASPLPRNEIGGNLLFYQQDRDREALVYLRVTIPLGAKPTRIDCSRLYELEIARLKREVELLRMAAE